MKRHHLFVRLRAVLACLALFSLVGVSCRQSTEPLPAEPKPTGILMLYTTLPSSAFDHIDLYLNGKLAGTIIKPMSRAIPTCSATDSPYVFVRRLETGSYVVLAKQFLSGKEVDVWDERAVTVSADKCSRYELAD